MKNPYLEEFLKIQDSQDLLSCYMKRGKFVREYAWSIPTDEALNLISQYSPIIEVGAGTGYWASLISKIAKIECYDSHPPGILDNDYDHQKQYYPVQPIEWLKWENTSNKTLFMSWPPYDDDMAIDTLLKYRGKNLIYIGEGEMGCTANGRFFKELEKNWIFVEGVSLPQWDGIHDGLEIYRRR